MDPDHRVQAIDMGRQGGRAEQQRGGVFDNHRHRVGIEHGRHHLMAGGGRNRDPPTRGDARLTQRQFQRRRAGAQQGAVATPIELREPGGARQPVVFPCPPLAIGGKRDYLHLSMAQAVKASTLHLSMAQAVRASTLHLSMAQAVRAWARGPPMRQLVNLLSGRASRLTTSRCRVRASKSLHSRRISSSSTAKWSCSRQSPKRSRLPWRSSSSCRSLMNYASDAPSGMASSKEGLVCPFIGCTPIGLI